MHLLNGPMLEYDFQHKDSEGYTLLHHATINNMVDIVKLVVQRLRRYYISVDIPDSSGYTPYLYAKELGHDEIAGILESVGASIHVQRRSANNNRKTFVRKLSYTPQIVQLKVKGQLPQLRKPLAIEKLTESNPALDFSRLQSNMSTNIGSLLLLKSDGKICDKFVHSKRVTDVDSNPTEVSHSSHTHSTSMCDLQEIFEIVSEQMTQSYCRPARKPKAKTIIFHNKRPVIKTAALAAIMKKPLAEKLHHSERRKSHVKRKQSRNEMHSKNGLLAAIPTIKTTYSN